MTVHCLVVLEFSTNNPLSLFNTSYQYSATCYRHPAGADPFSPIGKIFFGINVTAGAGATSTDPADGCPQASRVLKILSVAGRFKISIKHLDGV